MEEPLQVLILCVKFLPIEALGGPGSELGKNQARQIIPGRRVYHPMAGSEKVAYVLRDHGIGGPSFHPRSKLGEGLDFLFVAVDEHRIIWLVFVLHRPSRSPYPVPLVTSDRYVFAVADVRNQQTSRRFYEGFRFDIELLVCDSIFHSMLPSAIPV